MNEVVVQNGNSMLAPANIEQAFKLAEMMSGAKLVPAHLQGKPADCLLVIEQAARWKMSPFAVAQSTSVIQGKLMYEGKLVAAVVNANGGLEERLSFDYAGEGENRKITVKGKFRGEKEPRTVSVVYKDVKTANSMWQKQPDQQLMYSGTRAWARRHAPELMLGVYAPEEFDETTLINVTPSDTDQSKPKSPFSNAARRKEFQVMTTEAFHKAKNHQELTALMAQDKLKFSDMEASGAEADQLSLGEIRKQFQIAWNRLIKDSTPPEDTGTFDDDDTPPFLKQQMQDEKDRLAALGG